MADTAYIRVSVADVREEPDQRSELFSQLILGDIVAVLEERGNWLRCRMFDQNEGWLHRGFIEFGQSRLEGRTEAELLCVRDVAAIVYAGPEPAAEHLQVLPDGVRLITLRLVRHWHEVILPNGKQGWIPARYVQPLVGMPTYSTIALIAHAKSYLGIPYLWGGASSFGLDCSGLTQLVHRLHGVYLPRNARQQAKIGESVDITRGIRTAEAGDLVFFAEKDRVDHVALALGDAAILHASMGNGEVALNSLDSTSPVFNARLAGMLHSIRRLGQR